MVYPDIRHGLEPALAFISKGDEWGNSGVDDHGDGWRAEEDVIDDIAAAKTFSIGIVIHYLF